MAFIGYRQAKYVYIASDGYALKAAFSLKVRIKRLIARFFIAEEHLILKLLLKKELNLKLFKN